MIYRMHGVILVNPYLCTESEFYQPRRIAEELASRGVETDVIPNSWGVSLGHGSLVEGLTSKYDFCVYLDKDRYAPRIIEACGMRLFNRAAAVETCDDKMLTHIVLAGKVPMPKTFPAPLCYKADAVPKVPAAVCRELGFPLVVKECFGSFGEQVSLVRDEAELSALMEKLKLRPYLLQEFIGRSAGRDLRAIAVGGETVACMKRTSETDFRSNIAQGGKGEPFAPTEEVRTLARRVSVALGLDYCGIDFLFGEEGLLVCEVNSNAFFGGIERVTGVNVAGAYAEHICREIYENK